MVHRMLTETEQDAKRAIDVLLTLKPSRVGRQRQYWDECLNQVKHARAALALNPTAARGMYHAMEAQALSLVISVTREHRMQRGRVLGAFETNQEHRRDTDPRIAEARLFAAALPLKLSERAKAERTRAHLQKKFADATIETERTIRRWIKDL
jgi:hypothetical protein